MGNCCLSKQVRKYKQEQTSTGEKLKELAQFVRDEESKNIKFEVVDNVIFVIQNVTALNPGPYLNVANVIANFIGGNILFDTSDNHLKLLDSTISEGKRTLQRLQMKTKKLLAATNRSVLKKHKIEYDYLAQHDSNIDSNRYVKYGNNVVEAIDALNVTWEAIRVAENLQYQTPASEVDRSISIERDGNTSLGCFRRVTAVDSSTKTLGNAILNIILSIVRLMKSDSDVANTMERVGDILTNIQRD